MTTSPADRHGIAVAVRGVEKHFTTRGSSLHALSGIDLDVPEGRFVTLFGPSGCGKSTLLRILAGLEASDAGEVELYGQPPAAASARKEIAWIPQTPALLPWRTVRENARLSADVNRTADRLGGSQRVPLDPDELLAALGLEAFADARPDQLSGGMRQRASIARGFAQGAPLMLMDEPFSALDELSREAAQLTLVELWERYRKTVVFVTHSAAEAVLLSDQVVVMTPRPGRIHAVVDIDLPRPRSSRLEETDEFAALVTHVKHTLRSGWQAAE
ncbi:ABC transporter ATP-binding protein [Cellulomonas citrea]|uniref:ABC transporter ATP-binding protein n=1 Tax=Cellulomonas citrea TaxID=1909423 RepID=UPI00191679B5|nr:ABC transporter ATP-binding protein [Cellulomonas citrea]